MMSSEGAPRVNRIEAMRGAYNSHNLGYGLYTYEFSRLTAAWALPR